MMEKKLKKRWIAALRSGKYPQGRESLRLLSKDDESYSYCCLGVLCDLVNPDGWGSNEKYGHELENPDDEGTLSNEGLEKVGLTPAQQGELIRMNDDGASFEHIAKFIKTEYRSA